MVTSFEGAEDDGARGARPKKARGAPPGRGRSWQPGFRSSLPLALVCLTLLGSVAIPAHQTWRITHILRETVEGLAPARLLVEQLQSGLGKELVTLQSYAISGDDSLIGEYRATAAADDRRVEALRDLAERTDALSPRDAFSLAQRVEEWHGFTENVLSESDSATRASFAAALERGDATFDSSMTAISVLATELATVSAARDERVNSLEQTSIAANAGLVLAAMVAMAGVLLLTLRERRLTQVLQRAVRVARGRARREVALREAAEALAGAYTMKEVTQRIAHAALRAMRGRGAFVARIVPRADDPPEVVVKAVIGDDVLPLGAHRAFDGSYTKRVTESSEPLLVEDLVALEPGGSFGGVPYPGGSAIVLPLNDGGTPVGALFVLSTANAPFRRDSVARAEVFAHLAALAYEKVRLLEEAHERRRVLERVVQSRSRLMRGFSHDVKNPIGAADGFAELLAMGLFGDLNEAQQASVERMRRSIQTALALIEDLHALARAETGMVQLSPEPVDLGELARAIGEEYQAAASASGLSLSVKVECDDAVVQTDHARVRQIAANLLSNAIKYTDQGSVEVRVARSSVASSGEAGEWMLLEIVDTGVGIAPDKQEFIFEEFSRIGSGRAGAGLGLAISKLLAQALGGRLTVRSEEGSGSAFTLWLPSGGVRSGIVN
ncbi:MAG TPA: GAF domain-containing sensor histidine kinase [Gemmatimonadaceae bacterium]|nr:GAF domain-containing sensor histidine kinase [Gemmatimonadaceae bacterium]